MKMAAATENRQFVSIIDNEKIKKIQNLNNNNNPVSGVLNSNSRRPRNDSMSIPSTLFPCISPLNDGENILDWIVKDDCMWSTTIESYEPDLPYPNGEAIDIKVELTDATAHRPADAVPSAADLSPPLAAAAASDLPPSPPPSGTSVSVQSDSASYALSSLDELDLQLVSPDDSLDLLDVAQLHRIFSGSPAKRAPWNDEMSADVRPKVLPNMMARRGVRPAPKVAPQCTTLKRSLPFEEQPVANKMRRTVAASAARLSCAMSNLTDCEVVIREEEQEALEHVEVEYEVEDETQCDAAVVARDCTVPRRLIYPRNPGPRVAQAGLQRVRPGLLQPARTARPQRAPFGAVNPGARVALNAQPGASARPTRVGSFPAGRMPVSGAAPYARQMSFGGRVQHNSEFALEGSPLAGRLLGRPAKRFSMPSYAGTPVDDGASMAPRRGSSSYCSQMERNRRREMNTALAALRRLILEDDRSLLSKVYAENQINRRNTSMIMTLRAAHDAVLKLNDFARRANEERMEQLRRRDRLHKRLQQLQAACHTQPHVALVSVKHEWS